MSVKDITLTLRDARSHAQTHTHTRARVRSLAHIHTRARLRTKEDRTHFSYLILFFNKNKVGKESSGGNCSQAAIAFLYSVYTVVSSGASY